MPDYYSILGVARTATADEIKRAYRRLASQHHPDKGGDTKKFQEIQTAYDVLGDAQKRKDYDNPQTQFNFHHNRGQPNFNFNEIFEMFGARFSHNHPQTAPTVRIQLWISLDDVVKGGPRTVSLATGMGQTAAEITIPKGIEDGDSIRYNGIGPGRSDIVVTFRIIPDSKWERRGVDIYTEYQVSFWDLILGTDIMVSVLGGNAVKIFVPAKTQPGTLLRVKSHGLPHKNSNSMGDLYVRIQARLPDNIPDSIIEEIKSIKGQ